MGEKNWEYQIHEAPVDDVQPDGTIRRYEVGDVYATDDPCEMISFITRNVDRPRERQAGAMAALEAAAREDGCLGDGQNANVNPQPAAEGNPTQVEPPATGDSAEDQGAPNVQESGAVGYTTTGEEEEPPPNPPPGEPSSTHGGEHSQEESEEGEPVNLFRGAFAISETDLLVPTPTMPLVMVRFYRSGAPYRGSLGFNWDHIHNQFLRELGDGSVARWDGRLNEDLFRPDGAGFASPRGVFELLERMPAPHQGYTLTATEGLVREFERPAGWTDAERIPLVQIRDRHGNRLRYEYDGDRLTRVRDDRDRSLSFSYGDCGGLEEVRDHTGRVVRYLLDEYEHLIGVYQPATGSEAPRPDRVYRYASPGLHAMLRHGIIEIQDGDGRSYLQNEYEDDPSSWSFGRVRRQLYGDHEYQYRYTQLQWVPPRAEFINVHSVRVEMMAPDCGLSTFTFNFRGDLLDHRFRLTRDGSYRVVARRYEYDEAGNRDLVRHPDGREERLTYAATHADPRMRKRLLQRELRARAIAPLPSRIIWQGEWEPTYQLLVRELDETLAETRYRYDFDSAPGPAATGRLEFVDHPDATLPDGTIQQATTRFETRPNGQITAVTDPSGVRNEVEYFSSGPHADRVELRRYDALGVALEERYSYDPVGHVGTIRDASGAERSLVTDSRGRVTERRAAVVGGELSLVVSHYDRDGRVVAIERPRGELDDGVIADDFVLDRFERDVLGHVTSMQFGVNTASPRTIEQHPDYRGLPLSVTDPEGARFEASYDERGLLLEQRSTDADAAAKLRHVYDLDGRPIRTLSGPLEDSATAYDYDGFGRVSRRTSPAGLTHRLVWGPRELLEEERLEGDPGDGTVRVLSLKRYGYDERTRLVSVVERSFETDATSGVDLTTTYTYDAADRLVRIEDPRGHITRLRWDGLSRLIERVDPVGNSLRHFYDAVARTVRTERADQGPAGTRVRSGLRRFDARGRLNLEIDANGNEYAITYDDRNLPVLVSEPGGIERRRTFGGMGELLSERIDPTGLDLTTHYQYDRRSLPTSFIDPVGDETRYEYDGLGRLSRAVYPGGFEWRRSYGASGHIASELHGSGGTIVYEHDAAGRLTRIAGGASGDVADVPTHEYGYDSRGKLVRAEAAGVVVQRRYDSLGRLVREDRDGQSMRVRYDDLAGTIEREWFEGRSERLVLDANGVPSRIERTAAGALGSGSAELARFTLEGTSRLARARLLGGGLRQEIDFDQAQRAVGIRWETDAGELERVRYRYDRRHRRRVTHFAGQPDQGRLARFDARDRLTSVDEGFAVPDLGAGVDQSDQDTAIAAVEASADGASWSAAYEYDAADARTRETRTGQPDRISTYSPGRRLAGVDGVPVTHFGLGTRSEDAHRRYSSDGLGRITEVRSSAGDLLLRLAYDPLGRPGFVEEAGRPARTLRYFGHELWQEDEGGIPRRQFSHSPFQPGSIAIHLPGATLVPMVDGVGSVVGYVGADLQLAERIRYAPFGAPRIFAPDGTLRPSSAVGVAPIFAGMRWLEGSALYVATRRLMDPTDGAFLSPDPLGYIDGPNLYAYAGQDPLDYLDPDGEAFFLGLLAVMAIGAAIGGGINAVRQGIQIAEGSRDEFSWGEFGLSAGIGAVAAPILVAVPELAVPLAAWGLAGGIGQIADGNYATGTFDIVTSLAPFGFKGPRNATFGQGTQFGQMRGLGESASWSTRFGRFNEIGQSTLVVIDRARYQRFYRGTTYYEALGAESEGMVDLGVIIGRQETAAAPPSRGPGLYFTEELYPGLEGSAPYWADFHGGSGRGGGPAVLEATLGRGRWWLLQREPGVVSRAPQADVPLAPSTLETYIPRGSAPRFNQQATWRLLDWPPPPPPTPSFSPLWPTLFTPTLTVPDRPSAADAQASSGAANNGPSGAGGHETGSAGRKK